MATTSDNTLSLVQLMMPLWRRRRQLLVGVFAGLVIGLGHYLFSPRTYEVIFHILPEQEGNSDLIAGAGKLASLAGLSLGGSTDPSLVYPVLLRSRDVLLDVLRATRADGMTMATALGFEDGPSAWEDAYRDLLERIKVSRDQRSGIVSVRVRAKDPSLAITLARSLNNCLDEHLSSLRRSHAGQQRLFLENRIADVNAELTAAEEALSEFRQRNRDIGQSPELQLEEGRLKRQVVYKQDIIGELMRQLELSRLAEQNDVPAINSVDLSFAPTRPASPRLLRSCLFGVLLVLVIQIVNAYIKDSVLPYLRREMEDMGSGAWS